MKASRRRFRHVAGRRGSVVVCVIVCLTITTALITATTHSALRSRRQARVERQLDQVEWLLEAGALQAVARIEQSADYKGEVWLIEADSMPGFRGARIAIDVATVGAEQNHRVHVIAELPADTERAVRRTCEFVFRPNGTPGIIEE